MTGPSVLFVADAGTRIGGGHVMRSLTLARALQARGAACAFRGHPDGDAVLDVFAPDMRRTADETGFDALVFDVYGLGAADHRALAKGRPTLVIDDLADRPLAADLVLDSGPDRRAEDYAGLVPAGCDLLLGPAFAPVRPGFAALREAALARRGGAVRRVLVSLGLTDVGGLTATVLDRLAPLAAGLAVDVVVGSAAASLPDLEARAAATPWLTLHVDTDRMPDLTARADLAVGGGGSSSWERCTLGLPTLLLVVADNQAAAARALAEAGAAIVMDARSEAFSVTLDAALARLLADEALRRRLSEAAAGVCDGLGADRVADRFLARIAARRTG
ncbi:MAG: UDP-2,4-diacetamido-2,4,6-trideoxy-beta-L-altropyranose hydrolase [Pseudomonadota bacterium]